MKSVTVFESHQPEHYLQNGFIRFLGVLSIRVDKFSNQLDVFSFFTMIHEAEIADFHKALWKHMQQESADKFVGLQSHGFRLVIINAVFILKIG